MSSPAHAASPWPAPDAGRMNPRAYRLHVLQIGLWMFLGTATMLFGAFTSAMLVRRGGGDWLPTILPSILWLNTACLIGSSVALEAGRAMAARERWAAARLGVGAAIALGLVFLAGQLEAWRDLVAAGVYLPTNPHSAFFFILTGVHAVHLIAGLLLLTVTFSQTRPDTGRTTVTPQGVLTLGATFWHFFAAVWIYLFYVLSVL